jgi:8-oxo-dGTP diphosphatase
LSSRLYPERPFLAVSAAIFRGGKVLLAERAKPPLQGVFTLPGGMVETGEKLAIAAAREVFEEVGLEADILAPLSPVEIIDRDLERRIRFHAVVIPFAARYRSGDLRGNDEVGMLTFVDPADVPRYKTTQGLFSIIKQAQMIIEAEGV